MAKYPDKRPRMGAHTLKLPYGIGMSKTKRSAVMDITKECGEGKFFTRNYVSHEPEIRPTFSFDFIYIPFNP